MMAIQFIILMMGISILVGSFLVIVTFPGGITHLCAKLRHVFTLAFALGAIYHSLTTTSLETLWVLFFSSGAISMFVWPRNIAEIKRALGNNNIKCRSDL